MKRGLKRASASWLAEEWVRDAYLGILGRAPDDAGLASYSASLRARDASFAELLRDLASSDEARDKIFRENARAVVSAVYRGLLAREPDEAGLETYSRSLQGVSALAEVFEEVGESQEHWHLLFKRHAPALVLSLFQALKGREPSEAETESCVGLLSEEHGLAGLLRQLLAHEDAFQLSIRAHADTVISVLYEALLGRAPDPAGLDHYREWLLAGGSLAELVEQISASPEHWKSLLGQESVRGGRLSSCLSDLPASSELAILRSVDGKKFVRAHAETLVAALYRAVLGREADPAGLAAYVSALQNSADLEAALHGLIRSGEFKEKQSAKAADAFVSALTQLCEVRDEVSLQAFRSAGSEEARARALICAAVPGLRQKSAYDLANPQIQYRSGRFARFESPRPLCLVFAPIEIWIPFALAIADHLKATQGCETVIVWEQWTPSVVRACALSPAVYDVIGLDELRSMPSECGFSPKIIVTHSFGWLDQGRFLLNRFPVASLLVYADGFKNEVSPVLQDVYPISGAYYFGYQPVARKVSAHALIEAGVVARYCEAVAAEYEFSPNIQQNKSVSEPYAAVYIRYWGTGPYAFGTDETVRLMYETIRASVGDCKHLVLKQDKRAQKEIYEKLVIKLQDNGYLVEGLGDYLLRHGVAPAYQDLPVEYLHSKGVLCEASCHVVFDSSLGYSIPLYRAPQRRIRIAIGADLSGVFELLPENLEFTEESVAQQLLQEQGRAPRSAAAGVRGLVRYSKQYADAALQMPGVYLERVVGGALYLLCCNANSGF